MTESERTGSSVVALATVRDRQHKELMDRLRAEQEAQRALYGDKPDDDKPDDAA